MEGREKCWPAVLVIIDEFGFDRIERGECPQAANLFYKIIDARSGKSYRAHRSKKGPGQSKNEAA